MKPEFKKDIMLNSEGITDSTISILLVEDNPGDVYLIKEMLMSSGLGFNLKNVSTLKETLSLCLEKEFDVILLDLGLSDSHGLETLKKLLVFNVKSPVVVMTGLDDEDIALESLRQGAQDYLVKSRLSSENILKGIKYGIERKKIQNLLTRSARQFSLLSSTTTSINECPDTSSVFELACNNISSLLQNTGTFVIELQGSVKYHSAGLENVEKSLNRIRQITGINLRKPDESPGINKNELISLFGNSKLHLIPEQPNENSQEADNGIFIYGIGFARNGTTYGGMLIFTDREVGMEEISVIETISNQVSLTVHRKVIENDLKASENRYKKLNRNLEKKVKERTRDLETLNYQLNQELVERQVAEEALKKSEARLKELNATKDKFFKIIAHDLKNPFTSLMGSTEILAEGFNRMDIKEIMELVQIVNDSARSGYAILQNLLDWTRAQTGSIAFRPEILDLERLAGDNISDVRVISERKGITIASEVKGGMKIFADKNMMDSILRNLIGNAVKFTQKSGKVTVSASLSGDMVFVTIKDTGIGIPVGKLNELFILDSYYTRPGTQLESGTGLGLKLCKEFIEIQGGQIRVESKVGKGTKFIFSVPVKVF